MTVSKFQDSTLRNIGRCRVFETSYYTYIWHYNDQIQVSFFYNYWKDTRIFVEINIELIKHLHFRERDF